LTDSERVEILLRELGIINYSHMKGGTQNELIKSIEGLNGTADAIQLLWRVTKFVVSAK
jgi:hypothetical protein